MMPTSTTAALAEWEERLVAKDAALAEIERLLHRWQESLTATMRACDVLHTMLKDFYPEAFSSKPAPMSSRVALRLVESAVDKEK